MSTTIIYEWRIRNPAPDLLGPSAWVSPRRSQSELDYTYGTVKSAVESLTELIECGKVDAEELPQLMLVRRVITLEPIKWANEYEIEISE